MVVRLAGAARAAFASLLVVACSAWAAPQIVIPRDAPEGAPTKTGPARIPVRFNADALFALAPGATAELTLPDGGRQAYVYERTVAHGGGIDTWIARGAERGDNERAVITHGPGGTWGWMSTPYGEYRIYPGAGTDWLARAAPPDLARAAQPRDVIEAPLDRPGTDARSGVPTPLAERFIAKSLGKTTPTPVLQADLMILYTPDLAAKLGAGLLPMIYNVVATANQSYADSEIALALRLVNATMVGVDNSYASKDVLNGMGQGSTIAALNTLFAPYTENAGGATPLRDQVGADMVALLRDGPTDVGGIAYLVKNPSLYPTVSVTSSYAYSVINYCATGCEKIFAHEIGHNLGQAHDRATVARDAGGIIPSGAAVAPYAFAHYSCTNGLTCNPFVANGCPTYYAQCQTPLDPNDFATLMAYIDPIVLKFSNPNLTCYPAGGLASAARPCGVADQDDSARSINETRQNISAYRNQTLAALPGSLQFTNGSYSASETSGTITFTVSRTSGSSGAVSVSYAVAGATATAGIDFTPASGTLTWADGDSANKTFTVPIKNDLSTEGIETITATLSGPSGASGVYLGYPSTASGLLLEAWPAGGAMPAGWTQPASGSSVGWAPANDSAADSDGASLKSGALDFTVKNCNDTVYGAIPCPSVVQYTGNFTAGTVAFSYRVSGYPQFGFFEFLVDGIVAQQATGSSATADSGWQFFSTSIGAGTHTLQWRYRTRLGFACAGAISPPATTPTYPSCADRAWIDDVSLPLARAASSTTLASSLNPAQLGQSVTLTAHVSGGATTPTGGVAFLEGNAAVAGCAQPLALSSGTATCSTTSLVAGVHTITAVYSGDTLYTTSASSPLAQTVSAGPQLLSASPSTLDFGGQSMNTTSQTLATTITNTSAGTVTISGVTASSGFSVVSNGCSVLAPAATCQLALTFTPSAQGSASGTAAISYPGGGPTVVNLAGTGEHSLVTHYYLAILRRLPDSPGKAYWEGEATLLTGLGVDINEAWYAMAMSFFAGTEYAALNRDNNGYVTDLYDTFFNRPPDASGLAYWTGQLASGMPREVVLATFMFSPEFVSFTQAIFGNTAARAEVNTVMDFYRGILGRLPDSSGFTYWVGQFRSAQCQGSGAVYSQAEGISSAFALSAEYAGRNRTNAQYIGDLYNAFLRRGGDLAGVQYWIGQLNSGAQTREQVRQAFIASTEFGNRVNAIVSQGCLP